MKLNVTITESVHILAALYEKARRYEEATGESPRYVSLLTKKIRRQIQKHESNKHNAERRIRRTSVRGHAKDEKENVSAHG